MSVLPRYIVALLVCLLGSIPASAQFDQPMDWETFKTYVLRAHPEALQAELIRLQAASALLEARGGFDPKLFGDYDAKQFDGSNYFTSWQAGVKLPTWLGLEFKAAYNQANGVFLNPENKLPEIGQGSLGLSWTLGQGLIIDERRARLRQGRIGIEQAQAERDNRLNDLCFAAANVYWNWSAFQAQYDIFFEALRQARIRHEGLVESFLQGDVPAIDTLETYIQLQNREIDLNFAENDLRNALLDLRNFLWNEQNEPLALVQPLRAATLALPLMSPPSADELADQARTSHPILLSTFRKMDILRIERQLKAEMRKPVLDLNYNALGSGLVFFEQPGAPVFGGNMKWGATFAYPILNRKARGALQIADIKIAQTEYELREKQWSIENKIRQYANELTTLQQQTILFRNITDNNRTLLDAEIERFNFGESSVFLINAREQRWLDAQIKYVKLLALYYKTRAGLDWSSGVLYR
ncbi:MAG: TolC family protein [Saprospiraceae bacterium]